MLKKIISQTAFWQINKTILQVVGVEAALLLSYLIDKQLYCEEKQILSTFQELEFFYATTEQIEESTTLSYRVQKTCIQKLEEANMIKTKRRGLPAKLYFHICEKNIIEYLQPSVAETAIQDLRFPQYWNEQKRKTRVAKNAKQDLRKAQPIKKTILKNNTKKTTSKNNIDEEQNFEKEKVLKSDEILTAEKSESENFPPPPSATAAPQEVATFAPEQNLKNTFDQMYQKHFGEAFIFQSQDDNALKAISKLLTQSLENKNQQKPSIAEIQNAFEILLQRLSENQFCASVYFTPTKIQYNYQTILNAIRNANKSSNPERDLEKRNHEQLAHLLQLDY